MEKEKAIFLKILNSTLCNSLFLVSRLCFKLRKMLSMAQVCLGLNLQIVHLFSFCVVISECKN